MGTVTYRIMLQEYDKYGTPLPTACVGIYQTEEEAWADWENVKAQYCKSMYSRIHLEVW